MQCEIVLEKLCHRFMQDKHQIAIKEFPRIEVMHSKLGKEACVVDVYIKPFSEM